MMEESFWGSVQLMLFVYVLAGAVSFLIAWVIKLIFSGIKSQKARSDKRLSDRQEAAARVANGDPERKA
jgi:hypothetical protein